MTPLSSSVTSAPPARPEGASRTDAAAGSALKFPPGFVWGVATAPTQVEGHLENEWTDFTAPDGSNCRVACDNYHRYPEDIEWMARLGVKGYRMGIEWSRLQAEPYGPLNQKELARYGDLLDRLKAAGITPMVVLHHFSNPRWLSAMGGWRNPKTVSIFVDYVTKLAAALRDRVRIWNTFNEPDTYASCTFMLGEFPPHKKFRLLAFRKVIRHMAEAHRQVCELVRRQGSPLGAVEVGFTKNWTFFEAYPPATPWDYSVAAISDYLFNHFVMGSFLGNGSHTASTFLGLNYYGRVRFNHFRPLVPARGYSQETLRKMGVVCDDMFERHPPGMEIVLLDAHRKYGLPIHVTEHGSASTDEAFRARDLRENLASLHRGIALGADVRGFYYWSLLDNFEWQFGYTKKFGLIAVDFADPKLPRKMKPLGEIYRRICESNELGAP